jgi:hypothetical protein
LHHFIIRENLASVKSAGSELATLSNPKTRDWIGLRREYESSPRSCSLRYLARREAIPKQTMFVRASREGWTKREKMVKTALRNLEIKAEAKAIALVEDKLAPWIEDQKSKFTKRTFAVANRGVSRVSNYQRKTKDNVEARDEANMAKALESFTRVGRLALGLGDGQAPTGTLNFQMLSNKTAIQISSPDSVERP